MQSKPYTRVYTADMGCFVTSNENRTVITARSIPVNSPLSLSRARARALALFRSLSLSVSLSLSLPLPLPLSLSTSRIDGVTPGIPDHHQYCDCERGQRRPFPFSTAEVTGQNAWLTKEHANTTLDRAHGRTALTAGSPTPGRRVTTGCWVSRQRATEEAATAGQTEPTLRDRLEPRAYAAECWAGLIHAVESGAKVHHAPK